jgi:hypothetical protein
MSPYSPDLNAIEEYLLNQKPLSNVIGTSMTPIQANALIDFLNGASTCLEERRKVLMAILDTQD